MTALVSNWAVHLAQAFWQATIAGLVILAIVRLARRASPRLRHALVSLALIKFVIPPMLPLPTGLFSAARPMLEVRAFRSFVWADGELLRAAMWVHLTGMAIALARLAISAWRLRTMERRARAMDGYLLSDDITVPITTGRAVLIPRALHAALSADDLAHVLAHEREHQRRGDVRTGIWQAVVSAIWWFHPLVHLLVREARLLREERCDDAVVGRGCDRAGYARTLLHAATFVSGPTQPAVAAIVESEHTLLRRIRRMASQRYTPAAHSRVAWIVILIAALLLLPGARLMRGSHVAFQHFHHH